MSALTILACPSTLTEVDVKLRTAFDLSDVCSIRMQCDVRTPVVGASLLLQYSVDAGATWSSVGATVSIATAGDARGASVSVVAEARDDVLLSVFVRGGDDLTSAVLGNVGALAYQRTENLPCEGGCDTVPAGAIDSIVFGDYANTTALDAYVATTAEPTVISTTNYGVTEGIIDSATTFNEKATLRGAVAPSALEMTNIGGRLYTVGAAGEFVKVWSRHVYIDAGMDMVCAADADEGIIIAYCQLENNVAVSPNEALYLSCRNNRLMLAWLLNGNRATFRTAVVYNDLGAFPSFTGKWLRLLWHVELTGDQLRVRLYGDEACSSTYTELFDFTQTVSSAWGGLKMRTETFQYWSGPTPTTTQRYWEAQHSYGDDPTLYGLPA